MISLKKCREILGEKAAHLSDAQLELIRNELTRLAQINIKIIQEKKNKNK